MDYIVIEIIPISFGFENNKYLVSKGNILLISNTIELESCAEWASCLDIISIAKIIENV